MLFFRSIDFNCTFIDELPDFCVDTLPVSINTGNLLQQCLYKA